MRCQRVKSFKKDDCTNLFSTWLNGLEGILGTFVVILVGSFIFLVFLELCMMTEKDLKH